MSAVKSQRGRPKGSGLDDSSHLKAIATMIAANPQLKPTTAIRSLGIKDPSAIRRLRDKFHAQRDVLEGKRKPNVPAEISHSSVARSFASSNNLPPSAPQAVTASSRTSKPTSSSGDRHTTNSAHALSLGAGSHAPVSKDFKSADVFSCWWGVGLSMTGAAFDAQFTLLTQLVRLPPVSMAINQQFAFSEFAMATCASHARRRFLH